MKKLILLLLFIPLVSIGQTFEEIISINDLKSFKKVVIENNYVIDGDSENFTSAVVEDANFFNRSNNNLKKFVIFWNKNVNGELFRFYFYSKYDGTISEEYNLLKDEIKERCEFYDVINEDVYYYCKEGSNKLKVGFGLTNDRTGTIFLLVEKI